MGLFEFTWHSTAAAALTVGAFGLAPVLGALGGFVQPQSTFEVILDETAERSVAMVMPAAHAAPVAEERVEGPTGGEGPAVAGEAVEGRSRVGYVSRQELRGEGSRAVRSPTKPELTRAEPQKKGKHCESDPNPYIERTTGGTFQVDRDILTTYTRKWSALNDLGWSRAWEGKRGTPDGMQVGGLSCGNDLHDAGIRNGDIIHSVNGIAVRSIPEALLAYGKLKREDTLAVRITRRGSEKVITYHLRG